MAHLAFYKAKGDWTDWLIRLVTRSQYSHCEFVLEWNGPDKPSLCMTSSGRDGGVRQNWITLNEVDWVLVPIDFPIENPVAFFNLELGKRYDFWGLLFSQFFSLHAHRQDMWFCSEICAAALNIPNPAQYCPGDLYGLLQHMNQLWEEGKMQNEQLREKPNRKRMVPSGR